MVVNRDLDLDSTIARVLDLGQIIISRVLLSYKVEEFMNELGCSKINAVYLRKRMEEINYFLARPRH